jgi:hypothetical protein
VPSSLMAAWPESEAATMIRISEGVRNTHNQDGGIVLDVLHGRLYGLNFVGSRIIELLKQSDSETQIAKEISQQFGVSLETALADVHEFLVALEQHHLIERNHGASA